MKVYLSGPIYLDDKEATEGWRKQARKFFEYACVSVIDPCRSKATYDSKYFTVNEILFRDLKDVDVADVILVNFLLKEDKLPIGTVAEIMYAWTKQKPVVIVSRDPRIVEHPWIRALSVKIFSTLDEAMDYVVNFWSR